MFSKYRIKATHRYNIDTVYKLSPESAVDHIDYKPFVSGTHPCPDLVYFDSLIQRNHAARHRFHDFLAESDHLAHSLMDVFDISQIALTRGRKGGTLYTRPGQFNHKASPFKKPVDIDYEHTEPVNEHVK